MNLASKTFRNNKTGETIKVIDAFENIAILENKQKIEVSKLLDKSLYTEQIDPTSFFNNQNAYNILAEKIKTIPTDNIVDESITPKFGGEVQPATNESAIIQTSEEDEMVELARKYGVNQENTEAISKQQQAFSKYLDDGDNSPVTKVEASREDNSTQSLPANNPVNTKQESNQVHRVEDPIITMFKNVKRKVEFDVTVNISDKIPRLDFIEMMEESYEISIIDFLAEDFTNKILSDPSKIREMIKDKISDMVYSKGNKGSKTTANKSKPNAKERASLISKLDNINDIKDKIKGEKSKTVLQAANERIDKLKQIKNKQESK